ncbi:MAG TPA: alkaline phosphatase PhoX [Thermodesulfobacteriota bacterium]|nr:alkaline phosphatase PhoX [Thermodesulfobacteriota bacterium]
MAGLDRREFLVRTAAAGGLLAGAGLFRGLVARAAQGPGARRRRGAGYGPLKPAGPELMLPEGFRYAVVSAEPVVMDDGYPTPRAFDGMAAFRLPDGRVRLVRNHEDRESAASYRGLLARVLREARGPRAFAYDEVGGGGTTSLDVDPGTRRLLGHHWSLVGTIVNCAGGPTPWGSWITCEETTDGPARGWAKKHGYCFEVPLDTQPGRPAPPVPLVRLGRFSHEAVAVDPATGVVYETEDAGDTSGFYRFVPERRPQRPGELATLSGRLEMLAVRGAPGYETAVDQKVGVPLPVEWVGVAEPDPDLEGGAPTVFAQGLSAGGARFRRLEGCWFGGGRVYFHSTSGGDRGLGQVWVYDVAASTLTLLFESDDPDVLDGPDNICVTPRGGLVLCEDGGGTQFLRGLTPDGAIFDLARNTHNTSEFAGACFSPDGETLFVNIYGRSTTRVTTPRPGGEPVVHPPEAGERALTLAIWGPWAEGGL